MLRGRFEPLLPYPEWGPGRVDTFNAAKILFNFPLDQLPEHEKNGPSDFPEVLSSPRCDPFRGEPLTGPRRAGLESGVEHAESA